MDGCRSQPLGLTTWSGLGGQSEGAVLSGGSAPAPNAELFFSIKLDQTAALPCNNPALFDQAALGLCPFLQPPAPRQHPVPQSKQHYI
mmetsp:Transcript_5374/g.9582  ORF Transcript_5374/g.9582 Transcript_5374/m.9582 type:complete len:88 (+) Transcript_5374:101-364(+)